MNSCILPLQLSRRHRRHIALCDNRNQILVLISNSTFVFFFQFDILLELKLLITTSSTTIFSWNVQWPDFAYRIPVFEVQGTLKAEIRDYRISLKVRGVRKLKNSSIALQKGQFLMTGITIVCQILRSNLIYSKKNSGKFLINFCYLFVSEFIRI